jgi:hypothetical protein
MSFWKQINSEPSLDEILDDPIVQLLMVGDDTGPNEVRALVEKVRAALDATVETESVAEALPADEQDGTADAVHAA